MNVTEESDLRISVARIEGMLTATLARHDQRLDQHENTLTQHDRRLNEKGNTLARHDERIKDMEEDNSSRHSRITSIMALVISGVVGLIAVINNIPL